VSHGLSCRQGKAFFGIHLDKLKGGEAANAHWIDPRTGESKLIGRFSTSGLASFSTPAGWEDALLILEP